MVRSRQRCIPTLIGAALLLSGCGSESDEPSEEATNAAGGIELVRFLPQDAESYATVDLEAIRTGLGLPVDASPVSEGELAAFAGQTLNGVFASFPKQSVIDALDLPAATAAASGSEVPGDICLRAQGIATSANGSGVLAFEIDGEPDPSRVEGPDPSELGEPVVDGNQLVVPLDLDEPTPPLEYLNRTFAGYDCPK